MRRYGPLAGIIAPTVVSASSAGYLWVIAKRGARETKPSSCCAASELTFVHHAVDIEWQARPLAADIGVIIEQALHTFNHATLLATKAGAFRPASPSARLWLRNNGPPSALPML